MVALTIALIMEGRRQQINWRTSVDNRRRDIGEMEPIKLSGSFYVNENGIVVLLRGEKEVRVGFV